MTHDEMRAIRRELINLFLHESHLAQWLPEMWKAHKLTWCKEFVREFELKEFGYELQAYKESTNELTD